MGLFVKQQDQRSELQERIAAELRAKAYQSELQDKPEFDGSKDIKYLDGIRQTSVAGLAWTVLAVIAAAIIIVFLTQGRG